MSANKHNTLKPMATRIKRELSPEFIFGMNQDIPTEVKPVQPDPVMYGKRQIVDHSAWLTDVEEFNKNRSEV